MQSKIEAAIAGYCQYRDLGVNGLNDNFILNALKKQFPFTKSKDELLQ
jgi:hypothetical protein